MRRFGRGTDYRLFGRTRSTPFHAGKRGKGKEQKENSYSPGGEEAGRVVGKEKKERVTIAYKKRGGDPLKKITGREMLLLGKKGILSRYFPPSAKRRGGTARKKKFPFTEKRATK